MTTRPDGIAATKSRHRTGGRDFAGAVNPGYAPLMAFELTAQRVTADDDGVYDWRIGIGAADDNTHTLVLNHVERDRWPAIVREFGLIRVRNIHFRDDRERTLFVQDCDLTL